MCGATWTFWHHPELLLLFGGVALEPDFQPWDSRLCLNLWILLPQSIVEARRFMGFWGGKGLEILYG